MNKTRSEPLKRRGLFRASIGIRSRLFLLLLTILLPILVIETYIYYQRFQNQKAEELQDNLEMARAVSRNFEAFLADIFHTQLAIGLAATASPPLSNDSLLTMLKSAEGMNPVLRSYSWMTPDGVNTVSTNPKIVGRKAAFPEQFSRIQAGEECAVTPVFVSRYSGDRVFTIFRGIRDDKGKVLGVVACTVVANKLDHLMAIRRSKGAGISLIDNKGIHVYRHPRSEYTEDQRNWLKLYPVIEHVLKGEEKTVSLVSKIRAEIRLVAFAPISSVSWVAAASRGRDETLAGFISELHSQALWTLLITLAAFGSALVFARPISRSVIRLRNHALALGRGEVEKLPIDPGPGELQELSVAFNQMAEEVRNRENALRESEERLRLAQESGGVGVWEWFPKTGEDNFSDQMNRIYGLPPGTIRTYDDWARRVHPEDRARMEIERDEAMARREPFDLLFRVFHSSGEVRWIVGRGRAYYNAAGEIERVLGVNFDVTERKRAEAQVSRSQKTFSELVERAPFGIYVVDSQFRIAQMNAGSQTGAFRNVRPVIGRDFAEAMRILWPEPVAAEIIAAFRHTLETGEPYYSPRFINPRHDVETVESYEWELHRMTLPDGQYGVICYYFDSTKLREAEAALRESEERFRGLVTASSEVLYRMSPDWSEMRRLHSRDFLSETEKPNRNWLEEYIHPDDRPQVIGAFNEAIQSKSIFEMEHRVQRADGSLGWTFSRAIPLLGRNGEIVEWFGAAMDITERKKAEEELEKNRQNLEAMVQERTVELRQALEELQRTTRILSAISQHSPDLVFAKDCQSRLVYASESTLRVLGKSAEESLGKTDPENHADPGLGEAVMEHDRIVRESRRPLVVEEPTRLADGTLRVFQSTKVPWIAEDGRLMGTFGIAVDITERKRAEAALRRQAELIDLSHDAIVVRDLENRILFWSQGAEEVYGWTKDEVLGKISHKLLETQYPVSPEDQLSEIMEKGRWEGELVHTRKDGQRITVLSRHALQRDDHGRPSVILAINIDITERKRIEEQLRQAQRMEALGTLAGGIAHDFNNLLMPIQLNAEMALLDVKAGILPDPESLRLVQEGANRGKELVKQIIVFSRHKGEARKPIEISSVVNEGLRLLKSTALKAIEIRTQMEDGNIVLANPVQIHQVLMNLCLNAAHAMREKEGMLEVGLAKVEAYQDPAAAQLMGLKPGPYVQLTVKDNGHGMSPEVREKAFDPFFTTKRKGEGSGMGLAVVHGIVKKHEGAIRLESEEGKGTAVNIFLPVFQGDPKERVSSAPGEIVKGKERILFVDDEEPQVRTVQPMLKRLGYKVTVEMDPRRALDLFRSQPHAFDLVITDQVMPYLPGSRLAQELIGIRPDIPVIVCTGFSETLDEDQARAIGIKELILKPFTIKEISDLIRRALPKKDKAF